MVNPFRFLAYQKIYFDHYRNPLYELNDPTSYNVDSSFGSPSFSLASSMNVLRYRNWNKDYFTSFGGSQDQSFYGFFNVIANQNANMMARYNAGTDEAYLDWEATNSTNVGSRMQLNSRSTGTSAGFTVYGPNNSGSNSVMQYRDWETDRKSTRLNSSHSAKSRMPSSA